MAEVNSNISLITVGLQEYRRGSYIAEGGIAHIAEGILQSWDTLLRWSYKDKGGKDIYGHCKLGDLYKPVLKSDGTEDGKAKSAKWRAVYALYSPESSDNEADEKAKKFEADDQMAFQRGFTIAAARKAGVEIEFDTVTVDRGGKRRKVRAAIVPAYVIYEFFDESGKPTPYAKGVLARHKRNKAGIARAKNDEAILKVLADERIACVGGSNGEYGKIPSASGLANTLRPYAVAAGFMPPAKPRNTDSKAEDKGRSALESLNFITSSLDAMLSSDESDFAPSAEFDAKLRALVDKAQAYLAKFAD
jgi:hypothetical protein